MALGGSSNAVIHLIALARRVGIVLELQDFEDVAKQIPVMADLFPNGAGLMDDFYFAGGLLALLSKVREKLATDALTITGYPLGAYLDAAVCNDDLVIRSMNNPVRSLADGATFRLLLGNLCPDGAVIKASSADPSLKKHQGPALVFDSQAELVNTIDNPTLDVTADTVLILRNAGPVGGPGMPEWGNLPIPQKLLKAGVKDLVRISDARMSGTHYGTCILHVAPEAAVGGPLALVQTGDLINLDVEAGRLDMLVEPSELEQRKQCWIPENRSSTSGYVSLYQSHVTQANDGCDFDFYLETHGPRKEPEIL
jgi:dihydroxy-acid dehydratase